MRIAVDNRLAKNPKSGMGVYLVGLIGELTKNKEDEYVLLEREGKRPNSIIQKIWSLFSEQWWVQVTLPIKLSQLKAEVVYIPNPPAPLFTRRRLVLTIPDLSFYYDPEMYPPMKFYLYIFYLISAHKAWRITTFSNNSKKDIAKLLKVSSKKVTVIYPAINEKVFHRQVRKERLVKYKIRKPYILSVPGTFLERKNSRAVIEAFLQFPKKRQKELQIVFIGNTDDFRYEKFKKFVELKGLGDKVVFTGYVSKSDLVSLYSSAEVLAFPSLYEGFGLPPIEAMACGVPVVVYDNSCLPEIVGDAALVVKNSKDLASAILRLHQNKKLRQQLVARGRKRAKLYSWPISAKKFQALLYSK